MDDCVETERFISKIKERRSIWDLTSEEYKDKNLKKNQWVEIYTVFYPDFKKLVPREKGHIGVKMQKKWKHLRDAYVRYHRNEKRAKAGSKRARTYIYAQNLEFLKEILDQRTTHSSLQAEGDQTEQDSEDKEKNVETIDKSPMQAETTIHRRTEKRKRNIEEKIETPTDSLQKEKIVKDSSSDDMDFFRSLLPLVNELSLRQKMKFRSDVMKIAIEYSKIVEKSRVPTTPYPSFSFQQLSEQPHCQQLYSSVPYLNTYHQMPVFSTPSTSQTILPPDNIVTSEHRPQKEKSFPPLEPLKTKGKSASQVISPENFSNSSNQSYSMSDKSELNLNFE